MDFSSQNIYLKIVAKLQPGLWLKSEFSGASVSHVVFNNSPAFLLLRQFLGIDENSLSLQFCESQVR